VKKGKEYIDTLTDWDDFKGTLGLTRDEWAEIDLKVNMHLSKLWGMQGRAPRRRPGGRGKGESGARGGAECNITCPVYFQKNRKSMKRL